MRYFMKLNVINASVRMMQKKMTLRFLKRSPRETSMRSSIQSDAK